MSPSHLIDQLAATPRNVAHLVAEVDETRMGEPGPDGWPPRVIVAHLRDDEYLCMRAALESMLARENPELHFMEGGDWVATRNTLRDRREQLLADFALQRQATLSILGGLRPADWERRGHTRAGELTIAQLVERWAGHDAEHLAQLERAVGETLAEVRQRRAEMAEREARRRAGTP
ncbi:MAG: DinB family protein [Hyphomicrobiales bacterium]